MSKKNATDCAIRRCLQSWAWMVLDGFSFSTIHTVHLNNQRLHFLLCPHSGRLATVLLSHSAFLKWMGQMEDLSFFSPITFTRNISSNCPLTLTRPSQRFDSFQVLAVLLRICFCVWQHIFYRIVLSFADLLSWLHISHSSSTHFYTQWAKHDHLSTSDSQAWELLVRSLSSKRIFNFQLLILWIRNDVFDELSSVCLLCRCSSKNWWTRGDQLPSDHRDYSVMPTHYGVWKWTFQNGTFS